MIEKVETEDIPEQDYNEYNQQNLESLKERMNTRKKDISSLNLQTKNLFENTNYEPTGR